MDSVTICNLALGMLGIPAITSFDDGNNNAKMCKTFFPVLRDRVLRDHNWSFATAFFDLSALSEESPDDGYRYVCGLPADCIRVLDVADGRKYRLFSGKILVEELPARLEYIRCVEDTEVFGTTFVEALQYLLAAEIGMVNTRDVQLVSMYRREYEARLAIARSIDSSENRHEIQSAAKRSAWVQARGSRATDYGKTHWTTGTAGVQE